jgi:glycosyltransferase involved in cell wall biosynthesis
VSSCSLAKGLDLLLESFGRVFDADDDVSLIIKPLGELPNELVKQLDDLQGANSGFPNVVLIDGTLSEGELKALYGQCNVFVAPSRAEGFALPIANALLSGLPVVATAWGGHLDYCNKTNSWLVDFQFQPSRSQHGLVSSIWAEPVAKGLDEALWQAYRAEPATSFSKAWSGRKFLMEHYTWKDVALRVAALANEVKAPSAESARATRVGFVTTWNARCGIATYSRHLLQAVEPNEYVIFAAKQATLMSPDERNCVRTWQQGIDVNGLEQTIQYLSICSVEALVIQFTYGFFNRRELGNFVDAALAQGVVVLVEFHSTKDPHKDILNIQLADFVDIFRKCHCLLAHGAADLNRLKALGLLEKATLFPHGVISTRREPPNRAKRNTPPLITSFGFCLPNKGLPELVQAIGILKQAGSPIRLRMLNAEFPDPVSSKEARKIRTVIEELGLQDDVEFQTDFLDDDACLDLLAEADLLVNSYQKTDESASGAVRYGLAAGCPVAVTPLPIFDDLGESVFRLPGTAPEQMAQGIAAVLLHLQEETETAVHVHNAAQCWLEEHDIGRQGVRLMHTARALARLQPALA